MRCPPTTRFYFSVERADPRHALFVHEADNTRGLLYFKAALEASGQSAFEIDPATAGADRQPHPAKYAFVVLSDVGVAAGRTSKTSCANTCAAAARC